MDDLILELLEAAPDRTLAPSDLEQKVAEATGCRVDTFIVRDAYWRLIAQRRVDFTPMLDLRAT